LVTVVRNTPHLYSIETAVGSCFMNWHSLLSSSPIKFNRHRYSFDCSNKQVNLSPQCKKRHGSRSKNEQTISSGHETWIGFHLLGVEKFDGNEIHECHVYKYSG